MKLFLAALLFPVLSFAIVDVSALVGVSRTDQKVKDNSSISTTPHNGFSGGVLANIDFPTTSWVLTTGLLISEMGAEFDEPVFANPSARYASSQGDRYYQIPLIADYWLVEYVGGGAGLYFGSQSSPRSGVSADSDKGLVLHGQVKFPFGELTFITANVMYLYGLSEIAKPSVATADGQMKVENRGLLFHIGFGIGI